jgi:hypothetical protein
MTYITVQSLKRGVGESVCIMAMKIHILRCEVPTVVTGNSTVMWVVTLWYRECPTFQMNASPLATALKKKNAGRSQAA